ncbi:CocE/NonD family hydrolase [Roseinatronobacter alkalisoli]|uniref:CocE/NonD family hydrolase n=1 Tax=Roseinatronobacter alkalisoli TaxID=3028235 RepID=A0ABT5TDA4_9RHOB|nr:CocE/NonD family hydrolase [Roseinatronobacter sp. HJB301]MDD7972680.1 CocE/NonD family hydrolase [Roseinatronobacter sp. HJB301]
MFSVDWSLSERRHAPARTSLAIPISDGITLDAVVTRPDDDMPYPALLCAHAYRTTDQLMHMRPVGFSHARGHLEAGDPEFWARRGYAHVVVNVRGTGNSTGTYDNLGPRTIQDLADAIAWLASQTWCSGAVGMFGISYFAIVQPLVAQLSPPALKAIFAPYGYTDMYRDRYYHGGILSHKFMEMWLPTLDRPRLQSVLAAGDGRAAFDAGIAAAQADADLMAVPFLRDILADPLNGQNGMIADILQSPLDGQYYRERSVDYAHGCTVPAYFGGCWGVHGLHLPGALRSFANWNGPRKLTIGPPVYLDRPFYQYHQEALRWFDHWLKGNDTGMMDETDINLFIVGTGRWKSAQQWPLPETRFTRFYLHENGELSERGYTVGEGATTFSDSPYCHEALEFWTHPMVEETELAGPMVLNLHASTTDTEALWFVSVLHRDVHGTETLLTRGWLRGSQRATDPASSTPWQPWHPHDAREPLEPGVIHDFAIEIRPYAIALRPGERLGLRIKCADDEAPPTPLDAICQGHLSRATGARLTVHHNGDHPSHLVLPVTAGNRVGTFVSGGKL